MTGQTLRQRIVFLDYLRIFAFASVLVGHMYDGPVQAAAADPASGWHGLARLLWPWVRAGGVGVLVFFLVSGYIITAVLQRDRPLEFMVKRIFRIYPLYVAAVLLERGGLRFLGQPGDWAQLLPQLLLVGDWTASPYTLGGVEWTLRVEMGFYVFMALLHTLGLLRWQGGRHLPWVFAGLVILWHGLGPFPSHTGWTLGYQTLYFPFLLVGSLIYLGEQEQCTWPLCMAFALLVFGLYWRGLDLWQPQWRSAHFPEYALGLFLLAWALRRRLRAWRVVIWLSALTYAVYLLHFRLLHWLGDAAMAAGLAAGPAQAAALLGLLLVCMAGVRWIEQPGIALGRRLGRRCRC